MPPRCVLRLTLPIAVRLLMMFLAFCSTPVHAQLPPSIKRCLPYPTLDDEIGQMNEEVQQKMDAQVPAKPSPSTEPAIGVIDDVQFDNPIHLPDPARQQLVDTLKLRAFYPVPEWIEKILDGPIRDAWQDQGFFKVLATAKLEPMPGDSSIRHFRLRIHVEEGEQFRLGKIGFRSSDPDAPLVFSPQHLRDLVPMHEGDIFSAAKVREGLDNLHHMYTDSGYVDFVATPLTDIDDSNQTISIIFELDQNKQYRIGKVQLFGSSPQVEDFFRSRLKPGEIFSQHKIDTLIEPNKWFLSEYINPNDIEISRDVKAGTVDIVMSFPPCPAESEK